MKKILVVLTLMFAFAISDAQSVNDVKIKDFKTEYVQIVGISRFMSNKVTINVDYGQERKFFGSQIIKDENGNEVIFNGMIAAMNFFKKHGYEFKQAYVITVGNQNVYHWLLEKEEDLHKNIQTQIKN